MMLDSKDEQTVGADPGDCLSRDPAEATTAASAVLPGGRGPATPRPLATSASALYATSCYQP
jgi:hypothetical protein